MTSLPALLAVLAAAAIPTERGEMLPLGRSGWRVSPPIGFEPQPTSADPVLRRWRRVRATKAWGPSGDLASYHLEEVWAIADENFRWSGKGRPPLPCLPDFRLRKTPVVEGSHHGARTFSYQCESPRYQFARSHEYLALLREVDPSLRLWTTVRLAYAYTIQVGPPEPPTPLPGLGSLRNMQATLGPADPQPPAGAHDGLVPLLR